MSTGIYHGPPGSYKTSLSIRENLIPWILEGRSVVTNVEGIDIDKIWENYGGDVDRPDTQVFIALPTLSSVTFFLLRYFFCWAPVGCAFLIDEAQRVFPKNVSDASYKLSNINVDKFISSIIEYYSISPEVFKSTILAQYGFESITELSKEGILSFVENRPKNISEAFESHRHYNWDFVFTSPNISLVNPELRAILEIAYKLINQNTRFSRAFIWIVGGKNTYKKYSHEPTNAGLNNVQHLAKFNGKIDTRVFGCYSSTSTGLHNSSIAETGKKNSFGLLLLIASIVLAFVAHYFLMPRDFLNRTSGQHSEKDSEHVSRFDSKYTSEVVSNNNIVSSNFTKNFAKDSSQSNSSISDSESDFDINSMNIVSEGPFRGWYIVIPGCARIGKYYSCVINLQNPSDTRQFKAVSYESFMAVGYRIFSWGRDLHEIRFLGKRIALATPYFLPLVEKKKDTKDTNEGENRFKEKFIN